MISYLFQYPFPLNAVLFLAAVVSALWAICFHEWAHGFAAVKNGDLTPKLYGRLSLNPVRHLDPIGAVMFVCVGFGYAKPVPVNPYNFTHYKRGLLWVSFAGVLANLAMVIISVPLYIVCLEILLPYLLAMGEIWGWVGMFFVTLFDTTGWMNACLFVFNLIPIYPLDGYRMVETLSKNPNNRFLSFVNRNGRVLLIAFLLINVATGYFFDWTIISQLAYFVQLPFDLFWTWILV